MGDLQQEWTGLISAARSQNTQAVYRQALESFSKFIGIYFPGQYASFTHEQVALFISYLSLQDYAAATISAYVAGLSFHLRSQDRCDVTQHFVVRLLLEGCRRRRSNVDTRCPITVGLLERLLPCLAAVCTSYDAALFRSCFTMAFFGFLRVGEFTGVSRSASEISLRATDVSVCGKSPSRLLRLFIRSSKTDQLGKGCCIIIPEMAGSPVCPVEAAVGYLAVRSRAGESFFREFDGRQLTRHVFTVVLRKCLTFLNLPAARFASHSFRIGAATSAAMSGCDATAIQTMGRWVTDTHKRYIRINMEGAV